MMKKFVFVGIAGFLAMCVSFFSPILRVPILRVPIDFVVRCWDEFAGFAKNTLELSLPVLKQVNLKFMLPKHTENFRGKSDLALGYHIHSNSMCM